MLYNIIYYVLVCSTSKIPRSLSMFTVSLTFHAIAELFSSLAMKSGGRRGGVSSVVVEKVVGGIECFELSVYK